MLCRFCSNQLKDVFLDLGVVPPTNAYLNKNELNLAEKKYPLKILICDKCRLVQTEDHVLRNELFTKEYAYFSSVSSSWLEHAKKYSEMITQKLNLNKDSFVIELASNDGYLLKNFVKVGIPCLGIEPTDSTADEAEKLGIPVLREFFGEETAKMLNENGEMADLIIGNNVYAHVPDINDFTLGLKTVLKPGGTITLEFTHILNIIKNHLFDTIYHEHYSYYSLSTVMLIFQKAGLRVYDVERLATQGGSLRIYGCHIEDSRSTAPAIQELINEEKDFGLHDISFYQNFQSEMNRVILNLKEFLNHEKQLGKTIAAYGAAAKGNTLLNIAQINFEMVEFVCDRATAKQGKFMPGSHIPILPPSVIREFKPDWILILPWNLEEEIIKQLEYIYEWGGKFLIPIPELRIVEKSTHFQTHV